MLRGIRLGSLRVPGAAANEHQESRDISRDPSRRAPSRSRPPTTLKPAWEAPAALGRFDPFRRSATQQRGVLPRSVTGGAGEGKGTIEGLRDPRDAVGVTSCVLLAPHPTLAGPALYMAPSYACLPGSEAVSDFMPAAAAQGCPPSRTRPRSASTPGGAIRLDWMQPQISAGARVPASTYGLAGVDRSCSL